MYFLERVELKGAKKIAPYTLRHFKKVRVHMAILWDPEHIKPMQGSNHLVCIEVLSALEGFMQVRQSFCAHSSKQNPRSSQHLAPCQPLSSHS